jgi:carbamoyl-phosphate synthase large subunit
VTKSLTVAVTGLGSSDVTAPGIGVMRSLLADDDLPLGKLIGLAYEPLEAGAYEPGLADEIYLLPFPSQGVDGFLGRLAEIHRRSPIDILIANLDAEIPLLVKHRQGFDDLGLRTFLPEAAGLEMRAKDKLSHFADGCGLDTPQTMVAADEFSLVRAAEMIGYPVLVKGLYYDARLASSEGEVLEVGRHLVARWGYPLIVQEHVAGQEFDICALGDGRGGLVGAVPITKLYLTEKGKAWAGVTVSNPRLIEITARLVEALSWRGPLEVEILRSSSDGTYHLLEINPRFPAWVYLCPAAGQNLPAAACRLALGQTVTPWRDYQVGLRFVRSARDLIISEADFEAIHTRGEILGRTRPPRNTGHHRAE